MSDKFWKRSSIARGRGEREWEGPVGNGRQGKRIGTKGSLPRLKCYGNPPKSAKTGVGGGKKKVKNSGASRIAAKIRRRKG